MEDFQAVLLAGGTGSRMHALVDEESSKCMLPIVNHPMVWYPLKVLEEAGFEEVIVVVRQDEYSSMCIYLHETYEGNLRYEICPMAEDVGTADALRMIREKIKMDFIVMSSDTICNASLNDLIALHRTYDSTVTLYLQKMAKLTEQEMKANKKANAMDNKLRDFVGLDVSGKRLLCFEPEADLEDNIKIRRAVLSRFPTLTLHNDFLDSHIYVFRRSILNFLAEKKSISSIKGELIPYLVRKQFRNPSSGASGENSQLGRRTSAAEGLELLYSIASSEARESVFKGLVSKPCGYDNDNDLIRCFVLTEKDGIYLTPDGEKMSTPPPVDPMNEKKTRSKQIICLRANTVSRYMEANRMLVNSMYSFNLTAENTYTAGKGAKIQADPNDAKRKIDSVIGKGTRFGDRCTVKNSVIGNHCVIGSNVSITNNSIIMDHVTIEDNCKIVGSIVCPNAYVQSKCKLEYCQVERKFTVEGSSSYVGDSLVASTTDFA
eukprot:Nk52_evm84s270 gene=Nk52_evmTU84s270